MNRYAAPQRAESSVARLVDNHNLRSAVVVQEPKEKKIQSLVSEYVTKAKKRRDL